MVSLLLTLNIFHNFFYIAIVDFEKVIICQELQFKLLYRYVDSCLFYVEFHLMKITVMRKIFKKLKSRTINYGSYKHFSNEAYGESLLHELSREVFVNNDDGLQRFSDININTLNRHAPRKRKLARGNQMPFITKDLSKTIIKRSRLHNNLIKIRTRENKTLYTK